MDLLSIISSLENHGFNRNVEHIKSFAGFTEKDTVVWSKDDGSGFTLTVDEDTIDFDSVWKCCLIESLESVWYFVVLELVNGKVVHKLFDVEDLSAISYS